MMGQSIDQNMFVLDEFRNQYLVPEIDVLGALHVFGDCTHVLTPELVNASADNRDYGQASRAPLWKSVFQAAGFKSKSPQSCNCLVGHHAIRSTTVRNNLLRGIEFGKPRLDRAQWN